MEKKRNLGNYATCDAVGGHFSLRLFTVEVGFTGRSFGVFIQVQLVVRLCVVETLEILDFSDDPLVLVPILLESVFDRLGYLLLLIIGGENPTSVLSAHVWALGVESGWVVDSKEKVNQVLIARLARFVGNENGFGEIGLSGTHLFIRRVGNVLSAVGIADLDVQDLRWELEVLSEVVLHTPETPSGEHGETRGVCGFDG